MNKYQELLQVLEKEHQITCKAANIEETDRAKAYFQLLREFMDKETHKKPIDIEFGPFGDMMLSCPTCKHGVVPIPTYHGNRYYPRCPFCGQLLKGEEEMNKYKEALDEIKNIVLDKSGDGYHTAKYLQNFYYSSCETLQELVERATPKKLVATRHTRRCPSCNRQMSDINNAHPNMKFCPNCGQALDWGIKR